MSRADNGIGRRRRTALEVGTDEYNSRRQELIRAAATVFKEKGYEAATLHDVAQRFGSDRASLYYYVGGKQELFQEAIRGVVDRNLAAFEKIARRKDYDARSKLTDLIRQVIESYDKNYPYSYVYIQEDMRRVTSQETPWAKDMAKKMRRIESITTKLIKQGIDEGSLRDDIDPQLAVRALWGMLNWTHRWYHPGGAATPEKTADSFAAIFLDGLAER